MNLDDLLHDTLHDDRLALPVAPDTLDRVRRKRRSRQRLTVAGTALGACAVVGGVVAAATTLSSSPARLAPYAEGGVPAGSPVPSITPSFVPTSGRDWLLTGRQAQSWYGSHTRPSPPPGQSVVPSPAPLGAQSADLLADVQAAGLPAGARMHREDSVGGQPGVAAVHVTLADGTPLEIQTSQATEPFGYAAYSQDDNGPVDSAGAHVVDIPGTTAAAGVLPVAPFGFPDRSDATEAVIVVSRGGVVTDWWAPATVPLAQLQSWAFAAAQHSDG